MLWRTTHFSFTKLNFLSVFLTEVSQELIKFLWCLSWRLCFKISWNEGDHLLSELFIEILPVGMMFWFIVSLFFLSLFIQHVNVAALIFIGRARLCFPFVCSGLWHFLGFFRWALHPVSFGLGITKLLKPCKKYF